jgi:DNA-binding NtrC family response regulator
MSRSTMAKLLSVCRERGVLASRNAVLEHAGYSVVTAVGVNEALAALERARFDLILVGHLYSTEEKNVIADRAHRAGTKVLCMHSETWPPEVAADAFIHQLDHPEQLLSVVASLTAERAAGTP